MKSSGRQLSPAQRREIKWWVDFMYKKLDRMSADELIQLLASINHRINPHRSLTDSRRLLEVLGLPEDDRRKELVGLQTEMRRLFEMLVEKAKDPLLEKSSKEGYEKEGSFLAEEAWKHEGYKYFTKAVSPRKVRIFAEGGAIRMETDPEDFSADLMIHHFFSISNPMPVEIFAKCECCGNYMVPLRGGERATRYCSKACRWNAWHKTSKSETKGNVQSPNKGR